MRPNAGAVLHVLKCYDSLSVCQHVVSLVTLPVLKMKNEKLKQVQFSLKVKTDCPRFFCYYSLTVC